MKGREFDAPEVRAGIKNVDGVNKVMRWVLVDFGDDARASALPVVAILVAAEVQLLAGGKFFVQAHDAAIAADEQCLGDADCGGCCLFRLLGALKSAISIYLRHTKKCRDLPPGKQQPPAVGGYHGEQRYFHGRPNIERRVTTPLPP